MRRDDALLEDIQLACRRIARFVAGATRAGFLSDDKTRAAVEREITIIGEAAQRVTPPFKDQHPEVPWKRLVQLRNFYIHGYEHLDPIQVWATAKRLAPQLERLVSPLIAPDEEESE